MRHNDTFIENREFFSYLYSTSPFCIFSPNLCTIFTSLKSVDCAIVCMAQHRHTCLTACGRHQRSSLVDVSTLLTPRHYKCRRLVVQLSYACMEQSATRDSGLLLTFDIPEGDQVSPFSPIIRLTWRHLFRWSADV